ncbi:amidase signature domain-containing protein [Fomes fomentarius]|nr:amidase signature domain-containing protein [Fomes fomentarius]
MRKAEDETNEVEGMMTWQRRDTSLAPIILGNANLGDLSGSSSGMQTGGSIISPSNNNNLVGIKPTVGLTSRVGVIPISSHQDSIGRMTRSVADATIILSAIAGCDPRDNFTLAQPTIVPDALKADALKGVHLGVPWKLFELGATGGIDAALQTFGVDALLMPTNVASGPAVIAGYPIVSVPRGFLPATTPLGVARPVCESN